MKDTIHIDRNDVPRNLMNAFPGYNGRMFKIRPSESVRLTGLYWDGGSRDEYKAVNLNTGETSGVEHDHTLPPQFGGPSRTPKVEIPEGVVIVKHSIFCGKDMGLTFYVNPVNVTKMLPAPMEISEHEKIVLTYTKSLKSSYSGIKNYRFHEASRAEGITLDEWNTAKESCIQKKLLNKRGAITIKGRNCAGLR